MEFCEDCDFALDNTIQNKQLVKYCRNCGRTDVCESLCILSTNYNRKKAVDTNIKKHRVYDNRLQRTIHHNCANVNCPTIKNPDIQEAVTYNETDGHERVYICTTCLTEWKYTKY
jgi:DNA-directed RNA polymerase subunit M/transcription elongation factor TFIIS